MQMLFNCCHCVHTEASRWIHGEDEFIATETPDAQGRGGSASEPLPISASTNFRAAPLKVDQKGASTQVKTFTPTELEKFKTMVAEFSDELIGHGGLEVEVFCSDFSANYVEAKLRMDTRLTRLEVWPPAAYSVAADRDMTVDMARALPTPPLTLPVLLQHVKEIVKGVKLLNGEEPDKFKEASALTLSRRGQADVRIIFDSPANRDRAAASLRVLCKSVEQRDGEPTGDEVADEKAAPAPDVAKHPAGVPPQSPCKVEASATATEVPLAVNETLPDRSNVVEE